MAPKLKSSQSNEKLKQKSLMSFFAKPAPGASPSSGASSSQSRVADISSDPPDPSQSSPHPKTPKTRVASSSAVKNATFSRSSDGGSSIHETPPTSDPIDVDMLSEEEGEDPKPKTVRVMPKKNEHYTNNFDNRRELSARSSLKTLMRKMTRKSRSRRNRAYLRLLPTRTKTKRTIIKSTRSLNA